MDNGAELSGGAVAGRMDRIYRYQRHVYDATRKYYLIGRDRLIDELDPAPGDHVLELGCGTGRNLVTAALRYPRAHFTGVDISTEMLRSAERSVRAAGVGARVRLVRGDAAAVGADRIGPDGRFGRVFFSYSLSMIPDWQGALDRGLAALAPGGRLHIVDFGQQERLPALAGRAVFAWLAYNHVTPRAGLEKVLADRAVRHGLRLDYHRLARGYTHYAVLRGPEQRS